MGEGIDIPTTTISAPLNSFAHLVLMMFIGSIGFKISSLGTMLVRPVIVKLKAKNLQINPLNKNIEKNNNTKMV